MFMFGVGWFVFLGDCALSINDVSWFSLIWWQREYIRAGSTRQHAAHDTREGGVGFR